MILVLVGAACAAFVPAPAFGFVVVAGLITAIGAWATGVPAPAVLRWLDLAGLLLFAPQLGYAVGILIRAFLLPQRPDRTDD